jgi:hypothetical protein
MSIFLSRLAAILRKNPGRRRILASTVSKNVSKGVVKVLVQVVTVLACVANENGYF